MSEQTIVEKATEQMGNAMFMLSRALEAMSSQEHYTSSELKALIGSVAGAVRQLTDVVQYIAAMAVEHESDMLDFWLPQAVAMLIET